MFNFRIFERKIKIPTTREKKVKCSHFHPKILVYSQHFPAFLPNQRSRKTLNFWSKLWQQTQTRALQSYNVTTFTHKEHRKLRLPAEILHIIHHWGKSQVVKSWFEAFWHSIAFYVSHLQRLSLLLSHQICDQWFITQRPFTHSSHSFWDQFCFTSFT